MMKACTTLLIFFLLIFLYSCGQSNGQPDIMLVERTTGINPSEKTIAKRFLVPEGYERVIYEKHTFQHYLSNFPLQPIDAKVYYFNGTIKNNQDIYVSVLDIDVGKKDLQQCADAVMRLRAEYLYKNKEYDKIHFNFTNGFKIEYKKWAEGNRIKVSGNNVSWYKSKPTNYSYEVFKEYLEMVFTYAGTLSLSKEMTRIPLDSMQVGDVFIKGGSPGHAVIIMDMAVHKTTGKKIFMIAQSYMPAQSIHILANTHQDISPWYDLSKMDKLYSPEWTFEKSDLKRFSK